MANQSKFIKINSNILMEWVFDNEEYVTEDYKIITNLNEDKKRSFLSTTNLNKKSRNLFQLDSVLKKYAVLDTAKYNFLQEQNYTAPPTQYDTVRLFFPTTYNFVDDGYIGLYLKVFSYGYYNDNIFDLSNIFFDITDTSSSGLTNLISPFMYDEESWGKYYEFKIPSVNYLSNDRLPENGTPVTPNTINYNLTSAIGLSQTTPIFINLKYLSSKETVLGYTYYYAGESYKTSFPKIAEYATLGVGIIESTNGDYFEIMGTYEGSNENLDNFVNEMYNKGRKIRIEYDIYQYEEGLETNMQTIAVSSDDDFRKPVLFRPILEFTNTTAAIKVIMRVIDLVDLSTISKTATLGLTDSIQKYGKTLMSLNTSNVNKLKIYNSKPEEITLNNDFFNTNVTTEIIKVNTPQLIEVGKILVNSPTSTSDYKGMGLLNLVITPFDNIIQFKLAKIPDTESVSSFEQYDLSNLLNNSKLILTFKSDNKIIEKYIYDEAENNFKSGVVNFKILENDLSTLNDIYDSGYPNFYLILKSNEIKTLLYSGTFSFYEDIVFNNTSSVNINSNSTLTSPSNSTSSSTSNEIIEAEWPKAGRTVIIYTNYKNTTT